MSRLRIFLLFAALAGLATVFAACGSSDSGSSNANPKTVLEESTFEGIENADVDLKMKVDVSGNEGGTVNVGLSGPFQSGGANQLPELDMKAEASGSIGGKDVNFEGGLVLVPNKAYVNYEGDDYEVDPTTFSFVQSAIEEAQQKSGAESGTQGTSKCQEEAAGKFNAGEFLENLTNEGSADVGGTETTKISGDLNVSGALDAITSITEIPACSSQLEAAGPLPLGELDEAKGEIEKALKSASADVYVGEDNIIRRFSTAARNPAGGLERIDLARTRPVAQRSQRRPGNHHPVRARSRSATCSRSSGSTRSNCSREPSAAPASAACSKNSAAPACPTSAAPGAEARRAAAAAAGRLPRMRQGCVDAGRPAELRQEVAVTRPWRAAERHG